MTIRILFPDNNNIKPKPIKRYVNIWRVLHHNPDQLSIVSCEHKTLEQAENEPNESGRYKLLTRVEVELE
jgi:hypothetical protein